MKRAPLHVHTKLTVPRPLPGGCPSGQQFLSRILHDTTARFFKESLIGQAFLNTPPPPYFSFFILPPPSREKQRTCAKKGRFCLYSSPAGIKQATAERSSPFFFFFFSHWPDSFSPAHARGTCAPPVDIVDCHLSPSPLPLPFEGAGRAPTSSPSAPFHKEKEPQLQTVPSPPPLLFFPLLWLPQGRRLSSASSRNTKTSRSRNALRRLAPCPARPKIRAGSLRTPRCQQQSRHPQGQSSLPIPRGKSPNAGQERPRQRGIGTRRARDSLAQRGVSAYCHHIIVSDSASAPEPFGTTTVNWATKAMAHEPFPCCSRGFL